MPWRVRSLVRHSTLTIWTGLDDLLSKHIAHLFIRDPLVVFSETIDQDDESSSDHFEVRLKAEMSLQPSLMNYTEYTIHKLADFKIQTSPA